MHVGMAPGSSCFSETLILTLSFKWDFFLVSLLVVKWVDHRTLIRLGFGPISEHIIVFTSQVHVLLISLQIPTAAVVCNKYLDLEEHSLGSISILKHMFERFICHVCIFPICFKKKKKTVSMIVLEPHLLQCSRNNTYMAISDHAHK